MSAVRHIEILPNNVPSNNKIAPSKGNPVLSFNIGSQDALLNANTLRIEGKLNVYHSGTTRPTRLQNININNRLGVYGAFEHLNLSSFKYKVNIETIRHYNRMMSSYLTATTNLQDHTGALSQTLATTPNWFLHRQANLVNDGAYFSCPLPSGLLSNGPPINLSGNNGIGGLTIDINLASDQSMLYGIGGSTADLADAYYELEDCKLIAEVIDPEPERRQEIFGSDMSTIAFNSIATYYQTINSTNAIINMNLGLANVLGVFCNFSKAEFLENLAKDSLATYPIINGTLPSNINSIIFLKDGIKYPNDWTLNTNYLNDNATSMPDAQQTQLFKHSIMYNKHTDNNTLISPLNNNRTFDANLDNSINTGPAYGIGVAYNTMPGGDGVNFKNSNFGIQLDCELDNDSANAIFIYVHHKANIIIKAGQGIQVLQ